MESTDVEINRMIRQAIEHGLLDNLLEELRDEHTQFVRMEKRHTTTPEAIVCPHCGSEETWKHGFQSGNQMFLCAKCRRRFNTKGAPIGMSNSRARIASALSMYYKGLSLSDISYQLDEMYGNTINPSTVYRWLLRYTDTAVNTLGKLPMQTPSDTWVVDETVLKVGGNNLWFWDVIDQDTRFLLGSHLSRSRTTLDAVKVMEDAYSHVNNPPKLILSDGLAAYRDGIERTFGADAAHVRASPFTPNLHTNLIERFHGTIKERTKVIRGFKTPESANQIMKGFLINYNFMRPHMTLRNQTPAEVAGIQTRCKTWLDVVKGTCTIHGDEL